MKLFSTKEFAELSGVSIRTLKRWRKDGKLIPAKTVKGDKFYSEEQLAGVTKYFRVTNFDTLDTPKVTTKVTNSEIVTGDKIEGDKF